MIQTTHLSKNHRKHCFCLGTQPKFANSCNSVPNYFHPKTKPPTNLAAHLCVQNHKKSDTYITPPHGRWGTEVT